MASILIIDHEESIRYTFTDFLKAAGHNVVTATRFAESLEKIRQTDFDIVFAEVLLNDGNGMHLLEQIVQLNPVCRVIMMGGYPNHNIQESVLSRGAYAYLQKPVSQRMLLDIVDIAIQSITERSGAS
ncbi:MAG: response regulator [Pseudomonadota bacterium]